MRKHLLASAIALSLSLGGAAVAATAAPRPEIAAALGDPNRPAEDVAKDAARHPAEVLALAGVKSGDKVADLIMGGGYFTRILAATVGPNGKVYAYQPSEFIAYRAKYADEQKAASAPYPNVVPTTGPIEQVSFPEPLDVVITVQNYHDLHLKFANADTAAKVNAAVYKALKPGGVYLVIDHYAAAGAPLTVADSLHRIDIEVVKREVAAAGFVLVGQSDLLRNPADPRTALVFDASIRGKTDQFVLRFRKPG